ncbi:MAG TPA: hypothetical protein VFB67_10660 [Candidatus Polarisedimenticolaceae bacterium]|nr:hypothetical protein [Candidatus Polarisedimenticolaceae bacterium]
MDTSTPPARVDPCLGILTVEGLRRVASWADVTFGARGNHLKARIRLDVPPGLDVERTREWVDPVVGVILRTPGKHKWHGTLVADIGGTDANTDMTWQVFPSVGFDATKLMSVEFGWRFLDTKYRTGAGADAFEYDTLLQGPVAGLAFTF